MEAAQRCMPFTIEGTIRPQTPDGAMEYTIMVTIRNERGEEIERQLVGVGALFAQEARTFMLSVEAMEVAHYGRRRPPSLRRVR
jgi:hypothetical protein